MSQETYEVQAPAPTMPGVRVAILGTGKMGGILLQAFLKNNLVSPEQIFATVHHPERAQALSAQFGVEVTTDNLAAAEQADVILLGVKPIQVPALIDEIKPALTPTKMIALVCCVGEDAKLSRMRPGCELAVIRAMPNTPAMLGAGITALCGGRFVSTEQMAIGAEDLRDGRPHGGRRREAHGCGDRTFGIGTCVYLHHHRGAGGGRRECRTAARYRYTAGGADT